MPDFVQFRDITKTFGGVTALSGVSLSLTRGECHGLMGENGAGKSTLGKVLAGIHNPDSGELLIDGKSHSFGSPRDALAAGVAMVHQELAFCPDLSVAENLCLGRYPRRAGGLLLDYALMKQRAEQLLSAIGVSIDVTRPMHELAAAQEQLVQIAAAGRHQPADSRLRRAHQLPFRHRRRRTLPPHRRSQKTRPNLIYVSHRMPELFRLCDRMSILRDGRYVGTLRKAEMSHEAVVQMMIGRSVTEYFPQHLDTAAGNVVLSVKNLASPGKFSDVTFSVRAGEILGFAGLVGSGRSEIAQAIFGLDGRASVAVEIDGAVLHLGSVKASLAAGVGLVPEDRKRQGCVLGMPCRANISMAILDRVRRLGILLDRA